MVDDADPISVEAAPKAFGAAKCQSPQATRLPLQLPRSPFRSRLRTNAFTLPKQRGPESVRSFTLPQQRERFSAFTLVELSVTMGVLVLLVLLFTQLLNSAATITILGHKKMDADSQARQLLDRMAIDFAQMVKRSDVDYYVKSSWFASGTPPPGVTGVRTLLQPGNDQIAFYSAVPGYYPSATPAASPPPNSPVSLVAYRVNAQNKLERIGKGLVWNGVSTTDTPVVFMPVPLASPIPALEFATPTPIATPPPAWPNVADPTLSPTPEPSAEVIGPQVFRFEYHYMLKTNGSFTDVPWDTSSSLGVNGMRDVAAVIVDIAVIDPKSKVLLDNSAQVPPPNDNITLLGAQLIDWGNTTCPGCATLACPSQQDWQTTPGLLRAQWQCVLNAIIANGGRIGNTSTFLPLAALPGIRVYERYFYLTH